MTTPTERERVHRVMMVLLTAGVWALTALAIGSLATLYVVAVETWERCR